MAARGKKKKNCHDKENWWKRGRDRCGRSRELIACGLEGDLFFGVGLKGRPGKKRKKIADEPTGKKNIRVSMEKKGCSINRKESNMKKGSCVLGGKKRKRKKRAFRPNKKGGQPKTVFGRQKGGGDGHASKDQKESRGRKKTSACRLLPRGGSSSKKGKEGLQHGPIGPQSPSPSVKRAEKGASVGEMVFLIPGRKRGKITAVIGGREEGEGKKNPHKTPPLVSRKKRRGGGAARRRKGQQKKRKGGDPCRRQKKSSKEKAVLPS